MYVTATAQSQSSSYFIIYKSWIGLRSNTQVQWWHAWTNKLIYLSNGWACAVKAKVTYVCINSIYSTFAAAQRMLCTRTQSCKPTQHMGWDPLQLWRWRKEMRSMRHATCNAPCTHCWATVQDYCHCNIFSFVIENTSQVYLMTLLL